MNGLIEASAGGWSYGGAILTFAFPMILFIAVMGALYVVYTKPEAVPGRFRENGQPVSATRVVWAPMLKNNEPVADQVDAAGGEEHVAEGIEVQE
jgi:hypothetical protein